MRTEITAVQKNLGRLRPFPTYGPIQRPIQLLFFLTGSGLGSLDSCKLKLMPYSRRHHASILIVCTLNFGNEHRITVLSSFGLLYCILICQDSFCDSWLSTAINDTTAAREVVFVRMANKIQIDW